MPINIDNNNGFLTFIGNVYEVNFVLTELWVDSKFNLDALVNITVDDSLNKEI